MATKEELNFQVNSNIGEVSEEIGNAADNTKELDSAAKDSTTSFGGLSKAVRGLGAAIKGIGLALAVATLTAFGNVFRQNQKVIDFFNVTLKISSIAFNDLFRFLDDNIDTIVGYLKALFTDPIGELYKLGQAIQNYFVENLEGVTKLLSSVSDVLKASVSASTEQFVSAVARMAVAATDARKDINKEFDKMSDKVKDYTTGIIGSANAMVLLDKEAAIAVAKNKIILEQKDREAELQRQIRDDETKTFADRIEANEKLAVILDTLANAWLVAVSPMTSALPTMLAITLASVLNISTPCMLK